MSIKEYIYESAYRFLLLPADYTHLYRLYRSLKHSIENGFPVIIGEIVITNEDEVYIYTKTLLERLDIELSKKIEYYQNNQQDNIQDNVDIYQDM